MRLQILNLNEHPEALDTVAEWHYQTWLAFQKQAGILSNRDTLSTRKKSLQRHFNKTGIPSTYLAYIYHGDSNQKQLIGSVSFSLQPHKEQNIDLPWLSNLYVEKAFRRLGIAEKLIQHVCDFTKEIGFKQLYLNTHNQADYFNRRGWQKIGEASFHKAQVTAFMFMLL